MEVAWPAFCEVSLPVALGGSMEVSWGSLEVLSARQRHLLPGVASRCLPSCLLLQLLALQPRLFRLEALVMELASWPRGMGCLASWAPALRVLAALRSTVGAIQQLSLAWSRARC